MLVCSHDFCAIACYPHPDTGQAIRRNSIAVEALPEMAKELEVPGSAQYLEMDVYIHWVSLFF